MYTAKEFVLCPPKAFDENCIVVTLSASGTTPEAVAAAKAAKEKGAVSITIVGKKDSPLAEQGDYVFFNGDEPKYQYSTCSMAVALRFAVELLQQAEGYEHYDDMQHGFDILDDVIKKHVNMQSQVLSDLQKNIKMIKCFMLWPQAQIIT